MKITQIMLGKGFGGAERSFVDTALALVERGHEVQAICHKKFIKQKLLENIKGLQLETIQVGGEYDFITPLRIAKLLRKFKPEIVHTQMKRAAWHGGRAAHRVGIPVVSKLHNYVQLDRYKYVHTLIGTTEDQRLHALKLNWPEDRVSVIPNFSSIEPVSIIRSFSEEPFCFLSYGRYVHVKGFDLLLRAFKRVLDSGVNAKLIIGGEGEESLKLNKLAKRLEISEKVTLDVWIEDTAEALKNCDIFVLSSRSESFGIVLLETMACGVPIVSTRAKGPLQVLSDDLAYFADLESEESLADAMLKAVSNPNDACCKAKKALETYRLIYYKNAVLPQLEALYSNIIVHYKENQHSTDQ